MYANFNEFYHKQQTRKNINTAMQHVESIPFIDPDTNRRKASIVNERGIVLSTVSDRYTLVQNKDVFLPFIDRFGLDSVKKFHAYKSQFIMEINTGREFNLNSNDIIKERLIIQNSYNKTRSFSFMFGAFRMVCSNGLYSSVAYAAVKKIHVGVIPINDIVQGALNNYDQNNFDQWYRLRDKNIDPDFMPIIKNYNPFNEDAPPDRYFSYQFDRSFKQDRGANLWHVFNAYNFAIANTTNDIRKRISANKKAEAFLLSNV